MIDIAELNDALSSNYLLVDTSFRSWGGERTNRDVTDEVVTSKNASADAGSWRTKLLASADAEFKAVRASGVALRALVYARTLPWSLSKELDQQGGKKAARKGSRLLATAVSMQFLSDTAKAKRALDQTVLDLQSVWDARVQQALGNLGGMATLNDYPTAAEIPSLFNVTISLRPMPAIADFSRAQLPVPLAEALGQRMAAQTKLQVQNAMDDMRDRFIKEIKRMVEQLGKVSNDEKTKLYESMLSNTQSLCELARGMNLTGSVRFTELVDSIEAKLLRYPIETLREDKHTASRVASDAGQVLQEIEGINWF